ncbi:hypothetical protein HNQ80_005201 [Anaerosolibacter carboniphilus]|uniref:Uncharacterized protein n=1 Tax=Anaerosolibacter carboniphilus TaxID=1417629 RepID=A0A841L0F5_9FIRM|nr:hypothetical protein [Anaerosolibacter carboniphilus]
MSIKNVRTALKRFEKYEFLANESTNKNRLITIVNWDVYQSDDEELASKQASNGQANGKQRATNKNEKNDKNEKNKNINMQISNLRERYSEADLLIIDQYFDILRFTRRSGKIADSVIIKVYQKWEEFKTEAVIYALQVYINNPKHHDKQENYCYGIMRNATAQEIAKYKESADKQKKQIEPKEYQVDSS